MSANITAELVMQQLVNGVARGSAYALIAVGYTMVYGVLQLINFAHGDVYMLGAYFAYYPAKWMGYLPEKPGETPPGVPTGVAALIIFGSMALCAAVGVVIERLAYRPLRKAGRLAPLITAIGVSLFLQFGGQAVFGTEPKPFPAFMEAHTYEFGAVRVANTKFAIMGAAVAMMVALTLFVQKTSTGRALRAVSHDHRVASLMGINTGRLISITFALGSALAAVGGILVALDQPRLSPLMGLRMGLKAFVAAVLGGIGSIPGAALGAMLLGTLEALVGIYSTTYAEAVAFVVLILVLLFKPSGLLGKAGREKV